MYHHPSNLSAAVGGAGLMYLPHNSSTLHGLTSLHSNGNIGGVLHQQQQQQQHHNSHHHMMAAAAAVANRQHQQHHSMHSQQQQQQQHHHHHHHHLTTAINSVGVGGAGHHSVVNRQIFNHMQQTNIMPLNASKYEYGAENYQKKSARIKL